MGRRLLYLVRHGETDWNLEGRWQGHTDIPLNPTGYAQARAVADALSAIPFAGVVSSDLSRAAQTAQVVADRLGLPIAYADPDLRERSFGPFEGLTREECVRFYPEAWRAWVEEHRAPPGAESRTVVAARMTRAMNRVAAEVATGNGAALVVTHGGALRAAASTVTTLPPPIANGAIWRFEWDQRILTAEALVTAA